MIYLPKSIGVDSQARGQSYRGETLKVISIIGLYPNTTTAQILSYFFFRNMPWTKPACFLLTPAVIMLVTWVHNTFPNLLVYICLLHQANMTQPDVWDLIPIIYKSVKYRNYLFNNIPMYQNFTDATNIRVKDHSLKLSSFVLRHLLPPSLVCCPINDKSVLVKIWLYTPFVRSESLFGIDKCK